MFEIYDMVYATSNCTDLRLRGRVGLVFGVNKLVGLVHVVFDYLPYAVTVPESWVYSQGILCRRDRDAGMQRYLPGRFIRTKDDGNPYDGITCLAFERMGNHDHDGYWSNRTLYSVTVWTKSGKIFNAQNIGNLVAMGDCPRKDYSKAVEVNPVEHIRPTGITSDDIEKYCRNDISVTKQVAKNLLNTIYGAHGINSITLKEETKMKTQSQSACNPIKKVIFNDPATIVFWNDGTKTVVQARGEAFDPEKGLAMAICRHYLCDICHLEEYHGLFQKHLKNYKKPKTGYGYDAATIIIDTIEAKKNAAYTMLESLVDGNVQEITK